MSFIPQRFHLQGHAVNAEVLWAVQWVLGVLGVVWSLFMGVYISLGGADQLSGALYEPLMVTFESYHWIGAINIVCGLLGLAGLILDVKLLSIASALVGALWNGLLALYTIPENWDGIRGNGNLLGFYALFIMTVFLLRIVLLKASAGVGAVKLR